MRARLVLLFCLFVGGWLFVDTFAQSVSPLVRGAHRFERIADGIFYATASGTMNTGANSPIIVTEHEAVFIDSETTPAAARALVDDIKAVTDKPVKYVIDTHYHYDQAADKIDLRKYASEFPQIRAAGVDVAVTRRLYRLAQEPNAGPTP